MTPAAYLRLRRVAAGLSIGDVATVLAPRIANRRTAFALVRLWEADGVIAEPTDVIRLRAAFRFDVAVYRQLCEGPEDRHPRICTGCACSERDPCLSELAGTCGWASDTLCTRCEARSLRDAADWMDAAMGRTFMPEGLAA
ncbi:hypothetical protein ACFSGX_03890 [Sphingomonas arantia]|uniref:Transcriptional regulator n=1 Tax=Sphingomonas arantia TaxID=1460676 RepID=A0ABW4TT99_9SPHN